ncbi:sigma-70 family RNA polymerase sigma factor [Dermatophilaceae bacterium Soc4.6]
MDAAERRPFQLVELDDSEAVDDVGERLRAGERTALEQAYHRWSPLVCTVALRALGDHHDAEDVTQQVFVSAWHSRGTLRPGQGVVPGWLVGITRHRIADVRAQRYRTIRNVAAVARVERPEEAVRDAGLADRVLLAHELGQLGEPRGTVVWLAVVEQRPAHEVPRILDLPLGIVKSHVRRGLLQLRSRRSPPSASTPSTPGSTSAMPCCSVTTACWTSGSRWASSPPAPDASRSGCSTPTASG